MNINPENLLEQFTINPEQRNQVRQDLEVGIVWLRQKGKINIIAGKANDLPGDGVTSLSEKYFPAITITDHEMNFIERDNGSTFTWNGDPGIVAAELIIARTFKFIGDIMPNNGHYLLTIFVPREKPNCTKAFKSIKDQFSDRVYFNK